MPKTQARQSDWSSCVMWSVPGPVGYGHRVHHKYGRPGPLPVVLWLSVSREKGADRIPKIFLLSHTKNFFLFIFERLCAPESTSYLKKGDLARTLYHLGVG